MKILRLEAEAFENLAAVLQLNDDRKNIARAVLVDGCPQAEVAARQGVSKQWVNEVVRGVANGYGALADTAIVKVELHIPRGLAVELEALGAALENQSGKIGPDELAELRSVVRSTMRKLKRT